MAIVRMNTHGSELIFPISESPNRSRSTVPDRRSPVLFAWVEPIRFNFLLVALLFLSAVFFVHPAAAQDLTFSRNTFNDPSGIMSINDVVRDGSVHDTQLSELGKNPKEVQWIRLQVHAPAHGNEVVLYIIPTYINEVRLYEAGPGDPSTWKTRVTGNFFPFSERDRPSFSLGFTVQVPPSGGTYYLRVKSRTPSGISVRAFPQELAVTRDHHRDLLELFFVTSMVFLMLWAVHSYLLDRQKIVGLFALFQLAYTLFGIAVTGYMAPLNPASFPHLVDWLIGVLYLTVSFSSTFFCRELFRPYEPPPVLMLGMKLLLWIPPALLLVALLGYLGIAVALNSLLIKITWVLFLVTAFSLRKEQTPGRRSLQFFFSGILLNMVVFWFAWNSNVNEVNVDTQLLLGFQHLIMDGLVVGALFALILHTRTRQAVKEGQQSAMELLLVQERFKLEQELKQQIEIQAQTDYLTGISNRRHFVELAEQELNRAIRFQRPCTLLVIDVDHFKSINDSWGHAIGDLVLQQVAGVVKDALRAQDHFGRTGGEEFAVVLVETEGSAAVETAHRLCASVASALIAPCENCIPVTISIGVSQLQRRNIDFSQLLLEADRAMYSAKDAGRNCVVVSESEQNQSSLAS